LRDQAHWENIEMGSYRPLRGTGFFIGEKDMAFELGQRRGIYIDITEEMAKSGPPLSQAALAHLETLDLLYRSLCAMLFNYVPRSGHPGGSISSGMIVIGLLFDVMDYDVSNPDRAEADIISYAAGHKTLGLYALWALRNELVRIGAPDLLAKDDAHQLRLEDLLGFRRNPVTKTPLFLKYHAKALDGHPTSATPFVRLATGASGVGLASSLGLAFGARDYYGQNAPRVHIIEGEGGLTPGRAYEALAAAGTACLDNAVLHVDWNQASIDSDRVCRDGDTPGDYVQWTPAELMYLNDWNVIFVPDGKDLPQVIAAQRRAAAIGNGQPTSIVYKTVKGWQYGVTGRASHGAGHGLCVEGFYQALAPLAEITDAQLPSCEADGRRCAGEGGEDVREACFWESLLLIRQTMTNHPATVESLCGRLRSAFKRLSERKRTPRDGAPRVETIYEIARDGRAAIPPELVPGPGTVTTLRGELGRVLGYLNQRSGGAILAASADLLGSTSANKIGAAFAQGYYNASSNPESRLLALGGICEDAMTGILSGMATLGHHIGVASSYAAFLAPLGHVAARLHAIGSQARNRAFKDPYHPIVLICAHAGLKTGEDGPTHADPQPLQLLQENFPRGTLITLTPWSPLEIWPLITTALLKRPAVIAPFVTRPNERVLDHEALGLADPTKASTGIYRLRAAAGKGDGTLVLQGSGVTYAFLEEALPLLDKDGIDLDVYYVASAELFDLLSPSEQEHIFPSQKAHDAMGITGFTLPTMYRWIRSERGLSATMHPFQKGHYLGSGQAEMVLAEAGLDGESQYRAIKRFVGSSG
jgi:transketolase